MKTVRMRLFTTISNFLVAFFIFYLLSFIFTLPVSGQGAISPTLSISSGLKILTAKPGEEVETSVTLANQGKDPVPLGVVMMNMKGLSADSAPELTTAVLPRSSNKWVTTDPSELILEPGEKQDVTIKLAPPKDVTSGGYSSIIVFQAKLPSYYFDLDASIRALPALSVTVLANIGAGDFPSMNEVKIKSLETPRIVLSAPVPFVLELANPTGYFIFTNGKLNLDPAFGGSQAISELNGSILLPESTRRYVLAYTDRLWPGIYKADFTIEQLDTKITSQARFVALPWPFLLGFIGLLLATLILMARRRFQLAWRVLTGKHAS